jgi:hypothetical protein
MQMNVMDSPDVASSCAMAGGLDETAFRRGKSIELLLD